MVLSIAGEAEGKPLKKILACCKDLLSIDGSSFIYN